MKFNKVSQLLLVSFLGLIVATGLTACHLVTIAYVYVACSAGHRRRQRRTNLYVRR